MKNLVKIVAVMAIACVVTLKAYDKKDVDASDVVLVNVEALAELEGNLPEVVITCSKTCSDGVGRCWLRSNAEKCVWSGYMVDYCSEYPCG
jgi:hypothetical protein